MWKYFYNSAGEITYYSEELHFETEADDYHVVSDHWYDPRLYHVNTANREIVLRSEPLPPLRPNR
jgi:hypothetical protein